MKFRLNNENQYHYGDGWRCAVVKRNFYKGTLLSILTKYEFSNKLSSEEMEIIMKKGEVIRV